MSLPVDNPSLHGVDRPTLGTLLDALGVDAVEIVAAPHGLGRAVTGVLIWDAANPDGIEPGAVVLGIAVGAESPTVVSLIEAAAEAGAAAVVLKSVPGLRWVRAVAERVGIAVLAAPRELAWEHIYTRIRTTLAVHSIGGDDVETGPPGDLYELANAAAAAIGGAVEIDDAALNLLAFSTLHHEVDDLRCESILTRVPPRDFLDWLRVTGTLQRIRSAGHPVRVEPPNCRPRMVVPIRAGLDLLGFIWLVQCSDELDDRHAAELADIARVAAVRILRRRAEEDVTRRSGRDRLRAALEGGGDLTLLAERVGVATDSPVCLVGFRPRGGQAQDRTHPLLVESLVALRVDLGAHQAAVLTVGDTVYALIADSTSTDQVSVRRTAELIVAGARRQLRLDLVAGIGSLVPLGDLVKARREVDRVLGLVQASPEVSVSSCDEMRPRAVLAELREVVRDRPELLRGRIEVLADLDRSRNTDYLTTLRAFFDAACDLTEAAKLLFVHRNTLRYRIRRIEELSGLDLSDPVERLVAELQLRLVPTV